MQQKHIGFCTEWMCDGQQQRITHKKEVPQKMAGKVFRYFAAGNTAQGFYSLFDSVLEGLDRLFILKGGPGTGKSSLMKKIGNRWLNKGYDVEFVHCSSDSDSIDAVLIPSLKMGVVDGTAPHVIEPKAPGAVEEYVNLGIAWDAEKLRPQKENILALQQMVRRHYESAYAHFAQALTIHDDLESIYIQNMDFKQANQMTKELMNDIFQQSHTGKRAKVVHRFLGAATPTGPVHFIENLTEDMERRLFIKGRAGTGKSTLLRKLITAGEERGVDMEVYHCSFDPKSIDMVIFRTLRVAIFDSTGPHELHPSRQGDQIIDMYEATVAPGTDEKYAAEIQQISTKYKEKMQQGIASLREAKKTRDQVEKIYIEAMDFTLIDQMTAEIEAEFEEVTKRYEEMK